MVTIGADNALALGVGDIDKHAIENCSRFVTARALESLLDGPPKGFRNGHGVAEKARGFRKLCDGK